MKLWIEVFVCISAVLMNVYISAQDCTKVPKESNLDVSLCCSMPSMIDSTISQKIEEMAKNAPIALRENMGFACKYAEILFTEKKAIKNNVWDKDAYSKMLDTIIPKEEEYWKQILKDSFEQCQKSFMTDSSKLAEILSKPPTNIKKRDCDSQYLVMIMCFHFNSFVNCPEKAWKVTEKDNNYETCMNTKTWLEKCGNDVYAIQRIIASRIEAY